MDIVEEGSNGVEGREKGGEGQQGGLGCESEARSHGTQCSPLAQPALGITGGVREERTNQPGACALGCFFIPWESPGIRSLFPFTPRTVRESHKVNDFPSFTSLQQTVNFPSLLLLRIGFLHHSPSTIFHLTSCPAATTGPLQLPDGNEIPRRFRPYLPDLPIPGHSPRARFTRNDVRIQLVYAPQSNFIWGFRIEFIHCMCIEREREDSISCGARLITAREITIVIHKN